MTRTTLFGAYDHGTYGALERVNDHVALPPPFEPRQRAWRIVAKRCVLTAGAIERPLVFGNNDRPGVMLAGAVRTYLNRFAALPGRRAVVFANNDDAATVDRRSARRRRRGRGARRSPARDQAFERGARRRSRRAPHRGRRRHRRHRRARGARGRDPRAPMADRAASPAISSPCRAASARIVHLATHLGGRPVWDETIAGFVPGATRRAAWRSPGAARGTYDLGRLPCGRRPGGRRGRAMRWASRRGRPPCRELEPQSVAVTPLWRVRGHEGKAFIDFQNDVTDKDVELAEREGFRSVEHLKRYTTLGMATDQGKTANVNGLAMMAEITEPLDPADGHHDLPAALHAGGDRRARRAMRAARSSARPGSRLPMTGRRRKAPSSSRSGLWLRAAIFSAGRRPELARRLQPRGHRGAFARRRLRRLDARQDRHPGRRCRRVPRPRLLQFVRNRLPVGKARYGLMLREDGFVFDDGTTARLGPDHYLMTTTTANAAAVMQHLDFCHQVLWPDLDVRLRLGDRAMGAICDRRPEIARAPRRRSSIAGTTSRTRPSPTWLAAR